MRRKTDRFQHRMVVCLASLACAIGMLAAILGYRALSAINSFVDAVQDMQRSFEECRPKPWPKDF